MSENEKISKLEKKIADRANERVQVKLRIYKEELKRAFHNLTGLDDYGEREYFNNCLNGGIRDVNSKWPKRLWDDEEKKVREELFHIMDEAQKVYLAQPPKENDDRPSEE